MNIEELTKTQLILLTLLMSFVTSTATGVLAVGLLDNSPQSVTQTVNRIIERTIETVGTTEGQPASVITKETTVIVKEEDLITDAIGKHVRRVATVQVGGTTTPILGAAIVVPGDKMVIIDSSVATAGTYLLTFSSGITVPAKEVFSDKDTGFTLLAPVAGSELPKVGTYDFSVTESLKRGQSLIGLTSLGAVETGIVSLVSEAGIDTTLNTKKLPLGSAIISTSGSVVGIVRDDGSLSGGDAVLAMLARYTASLKAPMATTTPKTN